MNKSANNQKVKAILTGLKPWILAIAIALVLKYTGALSGISFVAQSALLHAGLLNAGTAEETDAVAFDYDFAIRDLQGKNVDFNDFRGKVIFLNLWATWCGPCRVEMPSIENLYNSVDREKVAFVMLSLDAAENHNKIVGYVKEHGFTFPVYTPAGYVPKDLQVTSIPTTLIIGKDGKVKSRKTGAANYDTQKFRTFLQELAEE